MAIIIPSKSIYSVKNPKIRDNIISSVETNASRVKTNNEYDVSVWSNSYYSGFYNEETKKDVSAKNEDTSFSSGFDNDCAYYELTPTYLNLRDITISRVLKNSYIESIKYGTYKNEQNEEKPNISVTIYYTKKTTPIVSWFIKNAIRGNNFNLDVNLFNDKSNIIMGETKTEQLSTDFIEIKSSYFYKESTESGTTAYLDVANNTNIGDKNIIKFSENGNEISIYNALICCGYESYAVHAEEFRDEHIWDLDKYADDTFSGEYVQVIPKKVDISIKGNTIGIDLEDIVNTSGNGNNPFKQDGNELLQITNFIDKNKKLFVQPSKNNIGLNDNYVKKSITIVSFSLEELTSLKVGDVLYYESDSAEVIEVLQDVGRYMVKIARDGLFDKINEPIEVSVAGVMVTKQQQKVLEEYANGKETAVINCSISEYKDTNGNIVVNPKESGKMLIEEYDIVIPYKQGFLNGKQQEVPLSRYSNGEPKQFQVLGIKLHTSGVLRQELTLQEISQTTLQKQ